MIKQFTSEETSSEGGGSNTFAEGVLANLGDSDSIGECPICLDMMQSPMIIPACMHQWCVILRCVSNDLLKEALVARIVSSATLHLARNVAKNRDVRLVLVVLSRLVPTLYI
jgi:hypothetical protein